MYHPLDQVKCMYHPLDQVKCMYNPLDQVKCMNHPLDQLKCMYHPLDQVRVRDMNNDVATRVRSVPTLLPGHQTSWELLPLSVKNDIIIPHHAITYVFSLSLFHFYLSHHFHILRFRSLLTSKNCISCWLTPVQPIEPASTNLGWWSSWGWSLCLWWTSWRLWWSLWWAKQRQWRQHRISFWWWS